MVLYNININFTIKIDNTILIFFFIANKGGIMSDLEKKDQKEEVKEKKKSEEIDVCIKPFNAESSRMDDIDDPCEQFE